LFFISNLLLVRSHKVAFNIVREPELSNENERRVEVQGALSRLKSANKEIKEGLDLFILKELDELIKANNRVIQETDQISS
jgi:hypothetical protein